MSENDQTIAITCIIVAPLAIVALAWIFLYYGNAAELRQIITLFIGMGAGGVGGYGLGRLRPPDSTPNEPSS